MATKVSTFRLPRSLRDAFVAAVQAAGDSASSVLERGMREYVAEKKRNSRSRKTTTTLPA